MDGACDEQLSGVLMDIFNLSLGQAAVPKCIKPPPSCHCLKIKHEWMTDPAVLTRLFTNPGISKNDISMKDMVST